MVPERVMLSLAPCRTHGTMRWDLQQAPSDHPWFPKFPKLSLLQLLPLHFRLSRGFFPWKSKAGKSHPLLVTGTHIPPALPHHFPWAQGSLSVPVEGTTLSPESSDGEFGKNNLPSWLLLPSFAGGCS